MSVILVTGGAGFIGSNLADYLLKCNNSIIVIDNFNDYYNPEIKEKNIADALKNKNFSLYRGNIGDSAFVDNILKKHHPDAVVHLAGSAGVRPSITAPLSYIENNIKNTVSLLECLKNNNVKKIVFASSSSVYGNSPHTKFSENDNLQMPISPYAASKLSCEHFLYTYARLYNITTRCLRFFTVYGPRQRPDLAICKFIQKIHTGKPIDVYGDGSSARDYTYIDDIVAGIAAALQDNSSLFEIVNLGNGSPVSLSDMIKTIEQALHKKAVIRYTESQPGDTQRTHADIKKARKLWNYQPKTTFAEGIEKYIIWLQNNRQL